jgi:PKD repeat protein
VVVSITGKWLYLWPGQETREPSCASDDTHVAVAAWGRLGVQVAIGELSEAQPDSRFDPPPPPPSIPAPTVTLSLDRTSGVAPCTVLATVSLTHADTWRWLLNGVIHKPDDGASHLFVLPAGTYTIAVRAGGTGGQTTSVPIAVTVTAPPIPDPPPVPEPPPVPPPVPLPAFLAGVQTGFGARLVRPDDNVFAQLRRRGWWMARVGVSLTDPAETAAIIAEVTDAGLVPLVIARPQDVLTLPWIRGLRVELGNEPDIGSPPSTPRMSPAAYVAWVEPALEAAKARRYALYTGGISNITPVAVGWLCSVLPYLPPWIGVCYHRYKQSPGDTAKTPRNGYASRAAEFAALKAVTGSRPLICSEFGWGTGAYRQRVWWFWTRTRRLTEQDVLTRTRDELALLASQQIDAGIVYQIGDGPPGIERDYFGIRRFDGTWKPVADVLL